MRMPFPRVPAPHPWFKWGMLHSERDCKCLCVQRLSCNFHASVGGRCGEKQNCTRIQCEYLKKFLN